MRAWRTGGGPFLGGRWRWLGNPLFLSSVFVLALNDHVLKYAYPGWWTGKLSDVAGLAVAATLAAVVLDVRRGTALAAAGFVLLKAVPGVAEAVRPLLGGTTRRDITDLLALAVLLPVWRLLRTPEGRRRRRTAARPLLRRCRDGLAAGVPLVGAVVAVVTTTATSCGPDAAVTWVGAEGSSLVAFVDYGYGAEEVWALSDDSGRSWKRSEPPVNTPADGHADPGQRGPLEACVDGTCWRIRDRQIVERRSPNAEWFTEMRLAYAELRAISTGCADAHLGVLSSITAVDAGATHHVVASLGAAGVLARDEAGRWSRHRVLGAPPRGARPAEVAVIIGAFASAPLVAIVLWLSRRRWTPAWQAGIVAIGAGTAVTFGVVAFILTMLTRPDLDPHALSSRAAVGGMFVTAIAAFLVASRPPRRRAIRQG